MASTWHPSAREENQRLLNLINEYNPNEKPNELGEFLKSYVCAF